MVLVVETRIDTDRPELVFDGIADLERWSLFTWALASLVETWTWDGAGLVRRMAIEPRGWWTLPAAVVVRWAMGRALRRNNRVLDQATRG